MTQLAQRAAQVFVVGAVVAGALPGVAAAQEPPTVASLGQPLVTLRGDQTARAAPRTSASRLTTIASRRPLTNVKTVLPVLDSAVEPGGVAWLRVRIPGRPNGRKGWIRAANTTQSTTRWKITVHLASRTVKVQDGERVVRKFRAIIGAAATPTPLGHFFVEEAVALDASASGAPYALALSARSPVLQEFNGGPGQIALHGTEHLAGALGTAASHGCVRLSPSAITWLAHRIGAGTPVQIV